MLLNGNDGDVNKLVARNFRCDGTTAGGIFHLKVVTKNLNEQNRSLTSIPGIVY